MTPSKVRYASYAGPEGSLPCSVRYTSTTVGMSGKFGSRTMSPAVSTWPRENNGTAAPESTSGWTLGV